MNNKKRKEIKDFVKLLILGILIMVGIAVIPYSSRLTPLINLIVMIILSFFYRLTFIGALRRTWTAQTQCCHFILRFIDDVHSLRIIESKIAKDFLTELHKVLISIKNKLDDRMDSDNHIMVLMDKVKELNGTKFGKDIYICTICYEFYALLGRNNANMEMAISAHMYKFIEKTNRELKSIIPDKGFDFELSFDDEGMRIRNKKGNKK